MTLKNIIINKKTSIGGAASILAGVAALLNMLAGNSEPSTENLVLALGLISAGFQGLMARDSDKSSQDNGIR